MDLDLEARNCVEAFDGGDYRECARQARKLFSAGRDYAFGQLLLISLQRLGETDEASRVGSELLQATAGDHWEQMLVRLSLGELSLDNAIAEAQTADHKCQAFYYVGARDFTQGRIDEAQAHFDDSLLVQSDC